MGKEVKKKKRKKTPVKGKKKKPAAGKRKKTTRRKEVRFSLKKFLLWAAFSLILAVVFILIPEKTDRALLDDRITLDKKATKPKAVIKVKPVEKKEPAPDDNFDYFKRSLMINGNLRKYFHTKKISRTMVDEIFEEKTKGKKRFLYTTFNIQLTDNFDLNATSKEIIKTIKNNDGRIKDTYTYLIGKREIITFYVSAFDQITHFFSIEKGMAEALHDGKSPVIAILIDDCGYLPPKYFSLLEGYENIDLAILPHTPYASQMIAFAQKNNNEVMLHLPMEPKNSSQATDKGMIFADFKEDKIRKLFQENLNFGPVAVGFNNHKGSKVTSDKRVLKVLMDVAKKKDLFFVDSRTTSTSVGYETAVEAGIPSIKRDVFLDNSSSEAYIIGQFHNLFKIAYIKGYSVGICHMRRSTLETFSKVFDEIRALNIRVVPVSYIIENKEKLRNNGRRDIPDNLKKMLTNIEED